MHKILPADNVDKLPVRPIVSNINTSTYELAKYLAKFLSPLSCCPYTVNSIKHFTELMNHEKIPTGYQMILFDVKSLLTSIPLDKTIEITLQCICDSNEITKQNLKKVMKELLLLCTKEVHFAYRNGIYQQNDDVTIGSPSNPVLVGIFMVELETTLPTSCRSLLK